MSKRVAHWPAGEEANALKDLLEARKDRLRQLFTPNKPVLSRKTNLNLIKIKKETPLGPKPIHEPPIPTSTRTNPDRLPQQFGHYAGPVTHIGPGRVNSATTYRSNLPEHLLEALNKLKAKTLQNAKKVVIRPALPYKK